MKSQTQKLVFETSSIIELNDKQALTINGGTETSGINDTCTILETVGMRD